MTTTARHSRTGAMAWMREGICLDYRDLPWIGDPLQTTAWELAVMGALCEDCPVFTDCTRYAKAEKVTAGFWAGKHRDSEACQMTGPGWAIDPLPGLTDLGGAA